MALTGATLIVGAAIVLGLPLAVLLLNLRKRHAGWWLLLGVAAFMILGMSSKRS